MKTVLDSLEDPSETVSKKMFGNTNSKALSKQESCVISLQNICLIHTLMHYIIFTITLPSDITKVNWRKTGENSNLFGASVSFVVSAFEQ